MSKIKWIKINTDMFYDEKIRLIDALPERDIIFHVWIRLLIQAGICNQDGDIFLREGTPYTNEMLSALFLRPLESIELALNVLSDFGMIEVLEDKRIRVLNWAKHQNVEGMDKVKEQSRLRMKKKRERDKKPYQEKYTEDVGNNYNSYVTVTEEKENNIKNNKNRVEENIDEITSEAMKILSYCEKITGIVGIFNLTSLKVAIADHGAEYLTLAIKNALQVDKPNMEYVNGILRNWRKNGYPNLDRELEDRSFNDSILSGGRIEFEPQTPKTLSREQITEVEMGLI